MSTDEKIDELARMVAEGFVEVRSEISEIREVMATKDDLAQLQRNVEVIMDAHIEIFHKDFDSLATRVKDLEVVTGLA